MATRNSRRLRYAVVGLGYISQAAVLPAFKNAKKNSELVALVSGNPKKLKTLGKKYGVEQLYDYDAYEECLDNVDAVYIALPNHLHREFTERAAEHGVHVLVEKPMAPTSEDCEAMIDVCEKSGVQLMVAYRLHFDEANLKTMSLIQQGKIGEPRIFTSQFTMQINPDNVRLVERAKGGGPLYDLGIYCINAARYLFKEEPLEVTAFSASKGKRFSNVEEMVSATLRFPSEKLANFTCSFGAADSSYFDVTGFEGSVCLEGAYEMAMDVHQIISKDDKEKTKVFKKRDQFAPELLYFSERILLNKALEPSGMEGLADVRVIEAIYRSIDSGKSEKVLSVRPERRPSLAQEKRRPPIEKMPPLVDAEEPAA